MTDLEIAIYDAEHQPDWLLDYEDEKDESHDVFPIQNNERLKEE